ncbi:MULTISPECIES: hypothetical protein [Clostridium]|uniref:hypothetical protein n=1 Tax=Clostridium TaxID=1485 RepID=UPI0032EDAFFE
MSYKIKYPKIKYFDNETRIPSYIIIKTDFERIKITYSDFEKYTKECEKSSELYVKISGEFDEIAISIDYLIEAFKPKDRINYKIKDKLLRDPLKISMGSLIIIGSIIFKKKNIKIKNLENSLAEMTKLVNDPSNAGRVLQRQKR